MVRQRVKRAKVRLYYVANVLHRPYWTWNFAWRGRTHGGGYYASRDNARHAARRWCKKNGYTPEFQ